MLDDGRFLVAWTDSSSIGFRARGRQYDRFGQALGAPFAFKEEPGLHSGRPSVASAGSHYRYTLLTARQGEAPTIVLDNFGSLVSTEEPAERSATPVLAQNYPNPVTSSTQIEFSLPSAGHVRLQVFDALGREVRVLADQLHTAGLHRVGLDAASLTPGLYLYRLQIGSWSVSRTMTVLR
jgi:hypothetical protein